MDRRNIPLHPKHPKFSLPELDRLDKIVTNFPKNETFSLEKVDSIFHGERDPQLNPLVLRNYLFDFSRAGALKAHCAKKRNNCADIALKSGP